MLTLNPLLRWGGYHPRPFGAYDYLRPPYVLREGVEAGDLCQFEGVCASLCQLKKHNWHAVSLCISTESDFVPVVPEKIENFSI